MNREKRDCQSCKSEFGIEPEDFQFYEKIKVPPPTFCPECRNIRRLAWREDHTLYRGTCALCGKSIISIHAPGGPFTVYCRPCWLSDKWNPMDYGRDYDFREPFFAQYRKLMEAVPRPALTGTNVVNSDYSHASVSCKNCYYVFASYFSEDSQYSFALLFSRSTYDSWIVDNSDHAYQGVHCNRLYNTRFVYYSDDCIDSSFLFDCVGCSSCFGCVNLRKQKYRIFNEQFSKEEYKTRIQYWDLGSFSRLEEAKGKFKALVLAMPHRYAFITNGINVTGDIIRDSKDCQMCFSALDGTQNCKYIYVGGLNLKDSYDVDGGGDLAELMYETTHTTQAQRIFFSDGSSNSRDVYYSDWANNCSDAFGCVGIRNKQYCILNKQYTKQEYAALKAKIIEHMNSLPYTDSRGRVYRFGEFFPTQLSVYAYNETLAFSWYPKTKEEVLNEGWRWQEPVEHEYKVTVRAGDLPDHIKDVQDSIVNEIIGCVHGGSCNEQCTTAFRITSQELAFYRKMNIALPRLCPNCRHAERVRWRNGFRLFEKRCMCQEEKGSYRNTSVHFHGAEHCINVFQTTYPCKG